MSVLPDDVSPPSDWRHNQRVAWEDGYTAAMQGHGPDAVPDSLTRDERGAWARGHAKAIRDGNHEDQDPDLVHLVQGGPS